MNKKKTIVWICIMTIVIITFTRMIINKSEEKSSSDEIVQGKGIIYSNDKSIAIRNIREKERHSLQNKKNIQEIPEKATNIKVASEVETDIYEEVDHILEEKYGKVCHGAIGKKKICMIIYRNKDELSGVFFGLDNEEKEIKLQGNLSEDKKHFILQAEDGNFVFKGNVLFDTKRGDILKGSFISAKGKKKESFLLEVDYPVSLLPEERYSSATIVPTFEVEEFAKKIKTCILEDDKKSLSKLIRYPITVTTNNSRIKIENAHQFRKEYDNIIDPSFKEKISECYTKYLAADYIGISIGLGEIWMAPVVEHPKQLKIIAFNNVK